MGMGDTPIGDALGDYPTGIPALDEVPTAQAWAPLGLPPSGGAHLSSGGVDQTNVPLPSTCHPIALQWSSRPKEPHSQQNQNHSDQFKPKSHLKINENSLSLSLFGPVPGAHYELSK